MTVLGSNGYDTLYHRLIINDCLDSGTQLPFIKRAMKVRQYYCFSGATISSMSLS